MTRSKGWNWSIVKGSHADFWLTPSRESFYLVARWEDLGLKNLLDLGCGLGRHAILFGKMGFNVSCMDISEEAIKRTRELAEVEKLNFNYAVGDALDLPYSNNSFDAIISYHVVNHTDTAGMKRIVSELYRVLHAGGECYLTLGSKETWGWKETDWPKVDENTKLRQEDGPENNVPHFYADYKLIEELFADFEIVNIQHIEEFLKGKDSQKTYQSWHYHILVRKP